MEYFKNEGVAYVNLHHGLIFEVRCFRRFKKIMRIVQFFFCFFICPLFLCGQVSKDFNIEDSPEGKTLTRYFCNDSIVDLSTDENLRSIEVIGDCCFANNLLLTQIILGPNVKKIGRRAFDGCRNLRYSVLPSALIMIDANAFNMCESLELSELPGGLREIGYGAFWGCDKVSISEIPASVVKLGGKAFTLCKGITSLRISDNLRQIEERTFAGCANLKKVVMPISLERIEHLAFARCVNLESVEFHSSINYIGREAFKGCVKLRNVRLPSKVTCDPEAFSLCENIFIYFTDQ